MQNGQPSNKHTRLIQGDAQRKRKKSSNMSRADITDLWRSEEVVFSAKTWRGVQSPQPHKLSWAVQRLHAGVTGWGHVQESCARDMQVAQGDLHLQMGGV